MENGDLRRRHPPAGRYLRPGAQGERGQRAARRDRGWCRDRLVLRGAMAQSLAQLGLPGQSVALALSDAGGEYFQATIPAAQILASPRGTLVRFRDRTGTIANGITSFTMGGGGRNRVTIRAQRLNLAGASAGAFTATLEVGAAPFIASGVLRAAGTGFRFP